MIPKDVFKDARVLDIGCNEGWVTCEIGESRKSRASQSVEPANTIFAAQKLKAKEVIGVDIDDGLIRAAWKRRRTVWSQQPTFSSPSRPSSSDGADEHEPKRPKRSRDLQGEEKPKNRAERGGKEYSFPAALDHMFGPLPIPPMESPGERSQFPHNVVFRTTDWPKDGVIDDREGYDVVLA